MIEQANFTDSPLAKIFEKETKTIKDQSERQTTENEVHIMIS